MQLVPLTTDPRQRFSTLLGNQRVEVFVWWNVLSESWFLTLDHGDTRVATSRQLTPWKRIIRPTPDLAGDLIVLAATGHDDAPLGREAWSTSHALWYMTADELDAARL